MIPSTSPSDRIPAANLVAVNLRKSTPAAPDQDGDSLSTEKTARTIADGLRVQQLGRLPFANIRAYTRDIVTVSEDEIRAAMKKIAAEARLIAEPSGAVALAGALKLGVDPGTSVAVLSGGNVEIGLYASILAG